MECTNIYRYALKCSIDLENKRALLGVVLVKGSITEIVVHTSSGAEGGRRVSWSCHRHEEKTTCSTRK
jgi:hypothetical protein